MKSKIDYSLYLVTDRELMCAARIEDCVERAILGGCTVVQLREKNASSRDFFNTALRVKGITLRYNVPLIINDRVDIALAVNAEGVHIGQEDINYNAVRDIIGNDKIVGVSASNLKEAVEAACMGADYLGVGAMYATGTKTNANLTSIDELKRIREEVKIPIVVIGGINKQTLPNFKDTGINGIAVVSAVVSRSDETAAAKELKSMFLELNGKK
jgi:thiamine-phosphate pyrophosphorylase